MPVKEVTEQGATRRLRPSDFDVPGRKNFDTRVPSNERRVERPARSPRPGQGKPGDPRYVPRLPRNPPKVWPEDYPAPKKASPFVPRQAAGFGRRIPTGAGYRIAGKALGRIGARAVPLLGHFLDAYDIGAGIGSIIGHAFRPKGHYDVPAYYKLIYDCGRPWDYGPFPFQNTPSCTGVQIRDYAVHGSPSAWFGARTATWGHDAYFETWEPHATNPAKWNRLTSIYWRRKSGVPAGPPPWVDDGYDVQEMPGIPQLGMALDPNILRHTPTITALDPALEPVTETYPDVSQPGHTRARVLVKGRSVPVRASKRRPPRKRERHKKYMSRAKRIMTWFFAAMDVISEEAEIVDAFFDALPKDVKDKWKCKRSDFGIDVAGQYGIDNADCKAKALYHNWHKLDFNTAVENVIKNAIQDHLLGFINRVIPNNSGSAFDNAMMQFNEDMQIILAHGVDLELYTSPWKGKFDYGLPPL